MDIKYDCQWEFNTDADNWIDFIKSYQLLDTFFNKFKDKLADFLVECPELKGAKGTEVTKENMFTAFDTSLYQGFYNSYDILEGLAKQYIKENDLSQIFFIEDYEELYTVTFYEIIPTSVQDLRRLVDNYVENNQGTEMEKEIIWDQVERAIEE